MMPGIKDTIFSARDYVAPTVFKKAGITPVTLPRWNYYSSLAKAIAQIKHLAGQGPSQTPSGSVIITTSDAQTLGINTDFYVPYSGGWYPVAYKWVRELFLSGRLKTFVARFYTTSGTGPYYMIVSADFMGLAATTAWGSAAQVQALDDLYREATLLKYRYNDLAAFLNTIREKQNITVKEQSILAEGIGHLVNMSAQIATIRGVEVIFNREGRIGVVPLLLIAAVVIFAGATAWTISEIIEEKEKTRRINDAFDLNKWVGEKMQQVASDPNISEPDKRKILQSLSESQRIANKVAAESLKDDKGLFGNVADIVKFGIIGLIALKGLQMLDDHIKRKRQ